MKKMTEAFKIAEKQNQITRAAIDEILELIKGAIQFTKRSTDANELIYNEYEYNSSYNNGLNTAIAIIDGCLNDHESIYDDEYISIKQITEDISEKRSRVLEKDNRTFKNLVTDVGNWIDGYNKCYYDVMDIIERYKNDT